MPAPFAASLCGYRNGNPNTSDASQAFSVELGTAFFDAIGIARSTPEPSKPIGSALSEAVVTDLQSRAAHLTVQAERPIDEFEQYTHLRAIRELVRDPSGLGVQGAIAALENFATRTSLQADPTLTELVDTLSREHINSIAQRRLLLDTLGEESVLGLDVAISRASPYVSSSGTHLVAGLSVKWSLRTDRAQDCRSQGAKMASLRRGRMPHFAAITMEPRPYFLAILGRGSGDLDCVYHLDLRALTTAIEATCSGVNTSKARRRTYETFSQLRDQGRLRDYDDLVRYIATV